MTISNINTGIDYILKVGQRVWHFCVVSAPGREVLDGIEE